MAVFQELRYALTGGWKSDIVDQSKNDSYPILVTRQGGEEKITLKEGILKMIDWHLGDEPLRKFNEWNPYDKER